MVLAGNLLINLSFLGRMETGGTLGMVPLIVNPIYTLHSDFLLGPDPLSKGSNAGVNS